MNKPVFRAWYKPDFETADGPIKFVQRVLEDGELVFCAEKDMGELECNMLWYPFFVPFVDDDWIVELWAGEVDRKGEIYFSEYIFDSTGDYGNSIYEILENEGLDNYYRSGL